MTHNRLFLLGDQIVDCPYCENKIIMRYTDDAVYAFCDNCHMLIHGKIEYVGTELPIESLNYKPNTK